MRILYVTRWFPYPVDNGIKIRIWNWVRQFSRAHDLHLVVITDEPVTDEQIRQVKVYACEVDCVSTQDAAPPGFLRGVTRQFSLRPRSLSREFSALAAEVVASAALKADVVIYSEIGTLPYIDYRQGKTAVLDDPELAWLVDQISPPRLSVVFMRRWLLYKRLSYYLRSAMKQARGCVAVSEQERQNFRRMAPGFSPVEVIPNCVDPEDYILLDGIPDPNRIVFAGSLSYPPNLEAVIWFVANVLPRLRAENPEIHLLVLGKAAAEDIGRFDGVAGLAFTGLVPDVRPYIAFSRVSVAPIWQGGGTRLKILEAMMLGVPVVTTSKAMEGLNLVPGRDLLVADDAGVFAQMILQLLNSPGLHRDMADSGRKRVFELYNAAWAAQKYLAFLEHAIAV